MARILFESGGRVSEVTGLMLGDWVIRGTLQEVATFSKGSHRRRVKFLRFSTGTAKLLRRYCDTDRRRFDPHGWNLNQYLVRFGKKASELSTVPLFLSSRRTQITPKAFRERYWNPACQAAGIEVNIHQARHWYVTMAVRHIYESSSTEPEVQRRLRELIEYMAWKSGWDTLESYQHYFDVHRHSEIQDELHKRMDNALEQALKRHRDRPHVLDRGSRLSQSDQAAVTLADADIKYLHSLGGGPDGD
ncbi:MAG: tyrosine-type recombinase/integrase [Acidobacteria bacterium]|nr:tyrosine-type recombinase/integrase [Acidobacteriota bacterium]MCI0627840.1 tyrosine-type recombinase/integrase [Acidobacteriota bacterium]MCI0718204.1 tyrosine-type recombinase/integrase [Acidobacteriota bacterium]